MRYAILRSFVNEVTNAHFTSTQTATGKALRLGVGPNGRMVTGSIILVNKGKKCLQFGLVVL
jgi:hypothetical protein